MSIQLANVEILKLLTQNSGHWRAVVKPEQEHSMWPVLMGRTLWADGFTDHMMGPNTVREDTVQQLIEMGHPHVNPVLGYASTPDTPFVLYSSRLQVATIEDTRLDGRRALSLAEQVVATLEELAEVHLHHGCISTGSVYVTNWRGRNTFARVDWAQSEVFLKASMPAPNSDVAGALTLIKDMIDRVIAEETAFEDEVARGLRSALQALPASVSLSQLGRALQGYSKTLAVRKAQPERTWIMDDELKPAPELPSKVPERPVVFSNPKGSFYDRSGDDALQTLKEAMGMSEEAITPSNSVENVPLPPSRWDEEDF